MKKIVIIITLFLTSLSYPFGAHCSNACPVEPHGIAYQPGNDPDTIKRLDQVTVTASRIESVAKESGRSVTVLQAKEIAQLPVESVDELLRMVAGVNINSRNSFGVQSDIGLRGSTFSQVVIMLDNMRINNPLTAHYNCNIPVSLSEIAQIEVVRGAAGTSFGPDAVGGIIHIKTKTFLNRHKQGVSSSGAVGGGEYGLRLFDANIAYRGEELTLSLGGKSTIANGQEYKNPNAETVTTADSTYRNFFRMHQYSAALLWEINSNWRLYSRGGFDRRNYAAKYFYTSSAYDESVEDMFTYWSQINLVRTKKNHKTEINASLTQGEDTFLFNPLFDANEHRTMAAGIDVNHTLSVNGTLKVAVGAQGGIRTIQSTDRGNHSDHYTGVYGILSKRFSKNINATLSSRIDYDENFGIEYLPHLSINWHTGNFILRSSAGKAVRGADFTERYVSFTIPSLSPGRNIGNPNLAAEKAWSFELGTDYSAEELTTGITLFHRASFDLIDYTYTLSDNISNAPNLIAGEYYYYTRNVTNASTTGIEAHILKHIITEENYKLNININYTWLNTKTDDNEPSKYIANHPKHIVNTGVTGAWRFLSGNISGTFITRNEEEAASVNGDIKRSYILLHSRIQASPYTEKAAMYIQVHNILNTEYQEILGARMPGRWISAGIKWRL
jgi:iron complex outermembrane receptor protein